MVCQANLIFNTKIHKRNSFRKSAELNEDKPGLTITDRQQSSGLALESYKKHDYSTGKPLKLFFKEFHIKTGL